jgi:hypothetical protein
MQSIPRSPDAHPNLMLSLLPEQDYVTLLPRLEFIDTAQIYPVRT